ncbi:proliferating cell nuclear antigen, N-terminal domain-containing protein [Cantharellus anzutake]|uniref:proliferating cell nuclear antigen, N-terminal domain-containing protein n=1 Tax=Cantharellus anzutake TaxID=1750568 RepID=UPI001904313B|nr:proliferating cell nuclear antigen, N-terminal domain-containing protein [Cantharellus anzutake]KAF8324712.1 proliferating cell nuclear antigen, N-terminal domain-containing protein [Cantharellus anzutake]
MFEAKLEAANVIKKVLEAAKELVTDANFECNDEGLNLQAMDNSHVALVAVKLQKDGFKQYRCDHAMPLGVNLGSLTKVLKCAKDDDEVTLRADDNADVLLLKFEAKNTDRVAEYEMKLMDIDTDTLGIPDTEYDAKVSMPAGEFQRICRELSQLGESVRIEVTKEGIRFNSEGDIANGSVLLKPTDGGSGRYAKNGSSSKENKVKKEKGEDEEMEDDEGGSTKGGDEERKPSRAEEEEEPASEREEEEESSKKRKRKGDASSGKAKKTKTAEDEDVVSISVAQAVSLSFSLKYLVNFAKSTGLTSLVELKMSADVPLLVSYEFEQGTIQYYLAPKIGDD